MTTPVVQHQAAIPEEDLADRLRRARRKAGLEQQELADQLGISRSAVSGYENGRVPKRPVILSWALATGVDIEWLQRGRVTVYKQDIDVLPDRFADNVPVTFVAA